MRGRRMLSRTLPTTVSRTLTQQTVEGPVTHPPQVLVWFSNLHNHPISLSFYLWIHQEELKKNFCSLSVEYGRTSTGKGGKGYLGHMDAVADRDKLCIIITCRNTREVIGEKGSRMRLLQHKINGCFGFNEDFVQLYVQAKQRPLYDVEATCPTIPSLWISEVIDLTWSGDVTMEFVWLRGFKDLRRTPNESKNLWTQKQHFRVWVSSYFGFPPSTWIASIFLDHGVHTQDVDELASRKGLFWSQLWSFQTSRASSHRGLWSYGYWCISYMYKSKSTCIALHIERNVIPTQGGQGCPWNSQPGRDASSCRQRKR